MHKQRPARYVISRRFFCKILVVSYITNSSIAVSLAVMHHWLCCITGCAASLAVLHQWLRCITGCDASLAVLHQWLCFITGCAASLAVLHHWLCCITRCAASLAVLNHFSNSFVEHESRATGLLSHATGLVPRTCLASCHVHASCLEATNRRSASCDSCFAPS